MWLSCKFCKEFISLNRFKEHQQIHGLPINPEKYKLLVKCWEKAGKPIIKGNVVDFFQAELEKVSMEKDEENI